MNYRAHHDPRVVRAVVASIAFHVGGVAWLSVSARADATAPRPLAVRLVPAEPSVSAIERPDPAPVPLRPRIERKRTVLEPVLAAPGVAPTVPVEPLKPEVAAPIAPSPAAPIEAPPAPREPTIATARADTGSASPPATTAPLFGADYLQNPAPSYPTASKRFGEQGTVLLRVLVNAAGAAESVLVKESSGFARLDESALDAVRRWRFVPARRGSDPIAAWVLVPVSFRVGRT